MTEQTTREGRCPEVFTNPGGYAIDELRKGDRCELDAGHDGLHAFVLRDGMFQWRTPDPTPEQTTEERGEAREWTLYRWVDENAVISGEWRVHRPDRFGDPTGDPRAEVVRVREVPAPTDPRPHTRRRLAEMGLLADCTEERGDERLREALKRVVERVALVDNAILAAIDRNDDPLDDPVEAYGLVRRALIECNEIARAALAEERSGE